VRRLRRLLRCAADPHLPRRLRPSSVPLLRPASACSQRASSTPSAPTAATTKLPRPSSKPYKGRWDEREGAVSRRGLEGRNDQGANCRNDQGANCRNDPEATSWNDLEATCRSDQGANCRNDLGANCRNDQGANCRNDQGAICRNGPHLRNPHHRNNQLPMAPEHQISSPHLHPPTPLPPLHRRWRRGCGGSGARRSGACRSWARVGGATGTR
jgi:hypothetical protein